MDGKSAFGLFILQVILYFSCSSAVRVTSKAGTFSGLSTSVLLDGVRFEVRQFLGIPYAEAPVKELRFRKPVAKQPFEEVYDATYHRAICPQGGPEIIPLSKFNISEDCLMLNIYAPGNSSNGSNSYAVIIYIHGGAFTTGGSNFYRGDVLSAYGDVIVVTFNYRLSIFGFLTTGDRFASGNFGLWDQHLAIKWVHENIAAFGGDPSRVILLGQSAGSQSAIYQALYPGNKGLFKGVIAESGTPISIKSQSTVFFSDSASFTTVGHHIGCSLSNSNDVVACLRNKTVYQIMSGLSASFYQVPFVPVVDHDFLVADPQTILDFKNSAYTNIRDFFSSLSFVIGGNNMDGASYMTYVWKPLLLVTDTENFQVSQLAFNTRVIPNVFYHIYNVEPSQQAIDMIAMRYSDITSPDEPIKSRDMLLKLSTDYVFTVPNLKTARLHSGLSAKAKTFVYEFTSVSSLVIGKYPTPTWVKGASHGDETGLVFGFSSAMLESLNISPEYSPTSEEYALSKIIMTLWTNFAKTGDPNYPRQTQNVPKWTHFTTETGSYMRFSTNESETMVAENYGQPAGKFWLELMPLFMNCVSKGSNSPLDKKNHTGKEQKLTLGDGRAAVLLIVLASSVGLLCIVLTVTCIHYVRLKRKEHTHYNAIAM